MNLLHGLSTWGGWAEFCICGSLSLDADFLITLHGRCQKVPSCSLVSVPGRGEMVKCHGTDCPTSKCLLWRRQRVGKSVCWDGTCEPVTGFVIIATIGSFLSGMENF